MGAFWLAHVKGQRFGRRVAQKNLRQFKAGITGDTNYGDARGTRHQI